MRVDKWMTSIIYLVKPFCRPEDAAVRSSNEQAARNRDRIVLEAARLFRERGFDGVAVADVMRGAGLTHGGFYTHFASKQELMALACRRAVANMLEDWRDRADAAPGDPLAAICEAYLSDPHRDDPGGGCLMAALGPDAARQAPPVRRAVTECLGDVLDALAARAAGADPAARRVAAIRLFTGLVGAMVVARAAARISSDRPGSSTAREAVAEGR